MDQELAAKLNQYLSVKVFMRENGWKAIPCSFEKGEIVMDLSANNPQANYTVQIVFAERIREIGGGEILVGGKWEPIYHQQGLDTNWDVPFMGDALIEAFRFTNREGDSVTIPVRYLGLPKAEQAEEVAPVTFAVRVGSQLVNVLWRVQLEAAQKVKVVLKAIEGGEEYVVESILLPSTKNFAAVDKLAPGKYGVRLFLYDGENKGLYKTETLLFDLPRA